MNRALSGRDLSLASVSFRASSERPASVSSTPQAFEASPNPIMSPMSSRRISSCAAMYSARTASSSLISISSFIGCVAAPMMDEAARLRKGAGLFSFLFS